MPVSSLSTYFELGDATEFRVDAGCASGLLSGGLKVEVDAKGEGRADVVRVTQ